MRKKFSFSGVLPREWVPSHYSIVFPIYKNADSKCERIHSITISMTIGARSDMMARANRIVEGVIRALEVKSDRLIESISIHRLDVEPDRCPRAYIVVEYE